MVPEPGQDSKSPTVNLSVFLKREKIKLKKKVTLFIILFSDESKEFSREKVAGTGSNKITPFSGKGAMTSRT